MKNFIDFLLKSIYDAKPILNEILEIALDQTLKDVNYHFPELSKEDIKLRIVTNSNELAVYLFRLGRCFHENKLDDLKPQIHWLLKQYCSCEIYFNNYIDVGFYIVHGQGTVIGSRNSIGKGFIVHQG